MLCAVLSRTMMLLIIDYVGSSTVNYSENTLVFHTLVCPCFTYQR